MASMNYARYAKPFFAMFGVGPYECFFCRTEVGYEEVHIHHINGDRNCNHPYNLAGVHHGCHSSFHLSYTNRINRRVGWTHSEETRAKIGAANSGRSPSVETRAKLRAARLGKRHTEETKAKIRAAALRRWETQRV